MARRNEGQELDPDGLGIRERRAIERFLIHGNKSRALREAGYVSKPGEGTTRVKGSGSGVFERPHVALVLKRELAEQTAYYQLTPERVIRRLAYLVYFDPGKLFNEDGSPKPMGDLDEATRYCIEGCDVEELYAGRGEDRVLSGAVRKYKLPNRKNAIELAMKNLKLIDGEGSGSKDRLDEVLAAFKSGPVDKPKQLEGDPKDVK